MRTNLLSFNNMKTNGSHPLSNFINFVIKEVEVGVEVKLAERALAYESVG